MTPSSPAKKFLIAGLGLGFLGALWHLEKEEDGAAIALSPFLAALAIEIGIFMLRHRQSGFLRRQDS